MNATAGVVGLVLHFRTPVQTLACLRSLRASGLQRAVLVDNSQDGGHSLGLMREPLQDLLADGLAVDVVGAQRNLGFAAGVALGVERLAGQPPAHLLLINSDAWLQPGALDRLRDALTGHALAVAGRLPDGTGHGPPAFTYYEALTGRVLARPSRLGTLSVPSGCCLLVRADLVRTDLFDRDFFFFGEDVMLGADFARRGLAIAQCPEAQVVHLGSLSARQGSLFYEYHLVRAHWLLAFKLARSPAERALFVAVRCVTLPLRALVRSLRGPTALPWLGLLLASADLLRGRSRDLTPPAPEVGSPEVRTVGSGTSG